MEQRLTPGLELKKPFRWDVRHLQEHKISPVDRDYLQEWLVIFHHSTCCRLFVYSLLSNWFMCSTDTVSEPTVVCVGVSLFVASHRTNARVFCICKWMFEILCECLWSFQATVFLPFFFLDKQLWSDRKLGIESGETWARLPNFCGKVTAIQTGDTPSADWGTGCPDWPFEHGPDTEGNPIGAPLGVCHLKTTSAQLKTQQKSHYFVYSAPKQTQNVLIRKTVQISNHFMLHKTQVVFHTTLEQVFAVLSSSTSCFIADSFLLRWNLKWWP